MGQERFARHYRRCAVPTQYRSRRPYLLEKNRIIREVYVRIYIIVTQHIVVAILLQIPAFRELEIIVFEGSRVDLLVLRIPPHRLPPWVADDRSVVSLERE